MEFDCRIISINKPVLNSTGVMEPLCNECIQVDCSNPIQKKTVSLFGKKVEWNVFCTGTQSYQVVDCAGFLKE